MTITLSQAIEALSSYTVAPDGDITTSQLSTFQAIVAGDLARRNPGFIGNELIKFEAYLVLDVYENKPGTGPRTQEKIKDNTYMIKSPGSSSFWMDCANKMIADFLYFSSGQEQGNEHDGVSRADTQMPELSDGYYVPVYGVVDDTEDYSDRTGTP